MEKSFKSRLNLLERNPISLGCWALGGRHWGGQSEKAAMNVMEAALENGILHFDTAQAYGVSERLVGKFLKDRRGDVFLASKVYPTGGKAQVKSVLQRSLEALQTDFIDLYYLHWPVADGNNLDELEALVEAKEEGLIGAIGVSNYSVAQMERLSSAGQIDFLQVGYHLLWRVIEEEILPWCREQKIRVVTYSSLGQGILTGKFPENPVFPKGDHRADHVIHFRKDVWPHVFAVVDQLKQLAIEAHRPPGQLALRWVAEQAGITSVLVGARNRDQIIENCGALNGNVEAGILEKMTRLSDELALKLPAATNIFGKA